MAERELAILISARDMASRTIKGVKKELGGFDKNWSRASKGAGAAMNNIERGVTIGAAAVVGGLAYSVKAAVDFEDAFAGVRKTVNEADLTAAGLTFEDLSEDIRQMAREMPISAGEIAGLAEAAGALGIRAQDISEFTRVAALLGTTTDVSAQDAATALGGLSASMGLAATDYDNFGAALVGLGAAGSSTESAILEVTQRAGGLAKAAGFSADQVLGWSSAVANLQMNNELAGSSIQRFIGKGIEAVGAGGKKLEAFADAANMTGKAFKRAFEEDASGALQAVVNGLSEMPVAERTKQLKAMGLTGVGLTTMFSGLANNTDNLNDSLANGERMWRENTAMTKEAEERFKTTASSLSILKNNLHDAAITIGSALLPELAELSREGTGWIQSHQPEIKAFAKDLAVGIKDAVKWAKGLDWEAIGNALKAGATGAKMIAEAFLGLPAPIQAFLAGGFAANKFTGGVIGDVVGEAAKGLIKGVLGINAGVVNVTGGVVNGGGVPGAGGKAGGGVGGLVAGLTAVGFAAIIADTVEPHVTGLGTELGKGWRSAVEDTLGVKVPTISPAELEWPFGPKNTPTILPEIFGGNGALGGTGRTAPVTPLGGGVRREPINAGLYGKVQEGLKTNAAIIAAAEARTAAEVKAQAQQQKVELVAVKAGLAAQTMQMTVGQFGQALRDSQQQAAIDKVTSTVLTQGQQATTQLVATKATLAAQTVGDMIGRAGQAMRDYATIGAINRQTAVLASTIRANRTIVNSTTVNKTTTVSNRYGPSGGSRVWSRIPGAG